MKECEILGGRNILRHLLHIFRRVRTPNPMDYAAEYGQQRRWQDRSMSHAEL